MACPPRYVEHPVFRPGPSGSAQLRHHSATAGGDLGWPANRDLGRLHPREVPASKIARRGGTARWAGGAAARRGGAGVRRIGSRACPSLFALAPLVRVHPDVLTALALNPGDPVRLTGRRETAGIVALAEAGASRALLYADDLLLGNLGIRDGGQVTVAPAPTRAAHRVTLAGPAEIVALVSPEMLRLALLGKVVTVEDNVSLLPQDVLPAAEVRPLVAAARRSLANTIGYAWTTALLTVTEADPVEGGLVTMDTVVGWDHGPATHSTETPLEVTTPDAPSIEDLPGLRTQAQELTELLDLGFNHREVLGRLGTTVTLGVLITGPAGAGKSALVRAVAGVVWAPEIAALTNDAAAARLRRAFSPSTRPAVVVVTDVEALAPRDAPSPLATVFRQLLAEALRAGTAVVCTTSRPESVDPSLRSPGLLDHELAVPLPDAALRREQLGVLTRR